MAETLPSPFCLDAEAQTYADMTGIAFGWTQEAPQRVVCACYKCGWKVVMPGVVPSDAPADYEDRLEAAVLERGRAEAESRQCPHLADYQTLKSEAPQALGMLTVLRQLQPGD